MKFHAVDLANQVALKAEFPFITDGVLMDATSPKPMCIVAGIAGI